MSMSGPTQLQMFRDVEAKLAAATRTFIDHILPGITRPEFEAVCRMHPHIFERFRPLVDRKLNPERFNRKASK